jgi:hypothetical protein
MQTSSRNFKLALVAILGLAVAVPAIAIAKPTGQSGGQKGTSGKVGVSSISITKSVSASSPNLF